MVELKRGTQIAALKAKGWTQDRECQLLQHGTRDHMGGPTFMRAPDGRIHAVSGGTERVLSGGYLVNGENTLYADGVAIGMEG